MEFFSPFFCSSVLNYLKLKKFLKIVFRIYSHAYLIAKEFKIILKLYKSIIILNKFYTMNNFYFKQERVSKIFVK